MRGPPPLPPAARFAPQLHLGALAGRTLSGWVFGILEAEVYLLNFVLFS